MLGFGMCIVENINVVAPDSATFVFCGIYDAVDHDFGAVGYHRRVDCNGMPGSSHGACTGMTAPAAGTAFAGTVASGLKDSQGADRRGGFRISFFLYCIRISIGVGSCVGKSASVYRSLDDIGAVAEGGPVHIQSKAMISVAFIVIEQLLAEFSGLYGMI